MLRRLTDKAAIRRILNADREWPHYALAIAAFHPLSHRS